METARLKTEAVFILFSSLRSKKNTTCNAPSKMNKLKNSDLVRKYQYTVRLNKPERDQFLINLSKANGMKESNFTRMMLTQGYVQAPILKKDKLEVREFLKLLIEYRTNFNRIASLIRAYDPSLNNEIQTLVSSMQKIIGRL